MADRRTPNRRLAAVIAGTGVTYHALACEIRAVAAEAGQRLNTAPSNVAYWVAGGTPSGQTPLYLAEALTRKARRPVTPGEIGLGSPDIGAVLGTDPLATAADLGRSTLLRRRDFLNSAFTATAVTLPLGYDHQAAAATLQAAHRGLRIGSGEVTVVRELTEHFRTADDRLGGGHGLTTATAYLTDTVTPLLAGRFPSAAVRTGAFAAAAQLACLIGWKHHDAGREGAAQKYYLLAFQLACEADPAGLAAWMMRALTHQALDLGHPAGCPELAGEALRRAAGRTDRRTRALLQVTLARAHGAAGDTRQAAAALLAAEDAASDTRDPVPSYAAASGPVTATVASHTAKTLTALHDHRAAEQHYRAALAGRAPTAYQRTHALTLANLADTVAAQHRHEEAVHLWHRTLDAMDGVLSHRARTQTHTIRSTAAAYHRRGIPGAGQLQQRAADLLQGRP
ncbi:hypothetical protein [Streptomyces clavuligerus]|nr:hypothetical protein [Streptomyces clavuligerus]WDN55948.1 tetratricopeptide repeat protein [Streptomyces clavuligerus]